MLPVDELSRDLAKLAAGVRQAELREEPPGGIALADRPADQPAGGGGEREAKPAEACRVPQAGPSLPEAGKLVGGERPHAAPGDFDSCFREIWIKGHHVALKRASKLGRRPLPGKHAAPPKPAGGEHGGI